MFGKIVSGALASRFAVLLFAVLILGWGVYAFLGLTIEAFPDPTDTQVNIITLNPGQPAEEMERQVSIPIERAINGMPGLTNVRDVNIFGLSYMSLTFRDGIDPLFARQQAMERLANVDLPDGVKPELGSFSTPIGEIYRYTLRAEDHDVLKLRTLNDWTVIPRLLRVEGVADVTSWGGLVKEIQIHPDPVAMASKSISMTDLADALAKNNVNASGGLVNRGPEQLTIRSEGLFKSLEDIKSIAVATRMGTPVFLGSIASVEEGWTPRQGIASRDADDDAIEGIILMRRGENPSAVLSRVRDKIKELNAKVLPEGTKIDAFYDRTDLVNNTLETVGHNLLEGALLVTFVLFVFLLDLRAAIIVGTLIPLSLLAAFIYLSVRGMAANLISMGAVDFGIIVDGAVVIIEAIVHRMQHADELGEKELTIKEKIERAVKDVASPTVFSLLIIIAAYLPIFLLQRVEGRIFGPMAHTVVAALVGSLLLSITLVPVLAAFAYRKPKKFRQSPVLTVATKIYTPSLRGALKRPILVMGLALLSLGGAVQVLATRGSEFLPELNEGAIYLHFTLGYNTSLDDGRKMVPILSNIMAQFPEVEGQMSQLGRPEDGTDTGMPNNLEYFVKLKPMDQWPKDVPDQEALIEKMNTAIAVIPGLDVNFSQPIRDNVNQNISGQFGQIALKIYADDLKDLQDTAEATKNALDTVPGVADLGIVKSSDVPQIQVRPRRDLLGRFGMSMGDVQTFVSTALGGKAIGQYWEGDKSFDVVLRLPEGTRETVDEISALRVPTPSGDLVPLDAVADVRIDPGRSCINRENGQRYIGVRMNVRNRDLGTFVADAQRTVRDKVSMKPGMTMEWGGEFESKERAMKRLTLVVPLALVITLGLLYNVFREMKLALLVLLNVPFALVGGAAGLLAFDMPVSIAAVVGFIALVGQASLNGVLVLSAIEHKRKEGMPLDEAIQKGAGERLRAVLMTAALAALGLIPAAFSKAMGAETQRPIAVVIVGGTLSAALLTLYVLPVMYRLVILAAERLAAKKPAVVMSDPNPTHGV